MKGICGRRQCGIVLTMTPGELHHCPKCNWKNSVHAARTRYDELLGHDVPTPDPKMVPLSEQTTPSTYPAQAFKSDAGKVQFDLLEDGAPNALLEIAKVMSWAVEVKGYHPHSWQEIPDAIRRYKAALGRHRNAIARGEVLDPESGLLHWAHAACCVIFITELELRSKQP